MNEQISYLEEHYQSLLAQPRSILTNIALVTNKSLMFILSFPLIPIQLVTTFVLGIFTTITFGLFALLLSGIWLIFWVPLLGTSWIWIHIPLSRFVLIIPGVFWALASHICATIFPCMGEFDARKRKLDLCDIWPLSWKLFKLEN
jgi:hypothetical protein